MKTPWWLHLLVGVVIVSTVLIAWHQWMLYSRDNPVVILHEHLYVPAPAYLDDQEKQALWNEVLSCEGVIVQQGKKLDAQAEVVEATADLAKATNGYTQRFGLYANDLLNRVEKCEADIKVLGKKPKQRKQCGEW